MLEKLMKSEISCFSALWALKNYAKIKYFFNICSDETGEV